MTSPARGGRRLYAIERPDVVVHLAAEVGGIGANRDNPGRYFYANMAMGLHLIEAAGTRRQEVRPGRHDLRLPEIAPVPFNETDLWDGYPEETNAPYGIAKKALLVMPRPIASSTDSRHLPVPVNLYGPGDNFDLETSHVIPALIRKFCEAQARADCARSRPGAPAAPAASSSTSRTRARHHARDRALRRPRAGEPRRRPRDPIRDLTELIARLTGFEGEIRWDPTKPDGQPRRMLDTSRAAERFGFRAEVSLEEGLRKTIDWWERSHG